MNSLLCSSHLRKLSFLRTTSFDQVTRYLSILEARNYAHSTTISVIVAIRRFTLHLPAQRLDVLEDDFTFATPHDIDCFVATVKQKGLAPSTINATLSLIKEFFDFLREEGEMLVQPVIRRRHRLFAPSTLPKPLAEDDLVQFFKAIDSIRDRAIFLLMLRCGLRVSEASSLTWKDIDFQAGTMRINNSKGQVDRIGYLAPDVEKSLKLWHARKSSSAYLFPAQYQPEDHLSTRHIYRLMMIYLKSGGVKKHYSPHCLRHTFATQLINVGVPLEVLKELMGHRSIQMTLHYTKLYESTKRQQYDEAMERIEKRQAGLGR